jgi:hypothetical protein
MTYIDDSHLPIVTDDELEAALAATRAYTAVVLKAGPRYTPRGPDRPRDIDALVWEHGRRNFALREAGLMPVVCPVVDGSGVTGISVFDASPEDVERIMSDDPAVRAGVFTYELHPTRSFSGSTLP